jgi:NADPH-dependent 2,4-dienoyl-CoA reductase/sulfur reductase-like enzyme
MSAPYDLAVIGAGPAGLEAAIAASSAGLNTVLIDSFPQAGGQYYKPLPATFGAHHKTGTEDEGEALNGGLDRAGVTAVNHALVWGVFKAGAEDGWLINFSGPAGPSQLQARRLILATGAYDTPVAFPGWTLPGVITCGAALTLLKNQRVAPFQRVLVSGSGPLLLSAAAHLIDAGVRVAGICEVNRFGLNALGYAPTMLREGHRLSEGASYLLKILAAGAPYRTGWSVVAAHGGERVEAAVIARMDASGKPVSGTERTVSVDTVICGYGLTPFTGLARMLGCKFEYHPERGGWTPWRDERFQTDIPGIFAAGDGAGIGGAENARLEGRVAGTAAAVDAGRLTQTQWEAFYRRMRPGLDQQRRFGRLLGDLFALPPDLISLAADDTLVCRCEEITLGEVKQAVAVGARTVGEVKMITRAGMGNCQGRMCEYSVAGAIVQALAAEGVTPESVGRFAARPPLHPLPLGVFFDPQEDSQT